MACLASATGVDWPGRRLSSSRKTRRVEVDNFVVVEDASGVETEF
jgi:hypothetical protein